MTHRMTHGEETPLRIALLDSWLQSAVEGSGTAVGIGGLEEALRALGHRVDRIAPPVSHLPITLRRLLFNLRLPLRFDPSRYDLVVGFDWDGVWLREQRTRNKGTKEQSKIQNRVPRRGESKIDVIQNRYVCSIKGVIAEELQHERGRIRLLFTLLARLEGRNARRADRVITTSAYCRERIAYHYRVPPERIGIVPEGIDVGAWSAALESTPPRSDPRPTILCVARQYPRKRVIDLIEAFATLRRHLPDSQLRIVGDGPEHERLMARARSLGVADAVAFLGGLPDEDVRREYAHCDVFCLPSAQEGFGIVFLEAMVAGKPVVSTTAAAIPEVVRHGETGVLVPVGDVRAIAGALFVVLADDSRRSQYGAAAQRRVVEYDWLHVTERFLREVDRTT
jgi:glycosyltransferase involved in cell wall biosynthesis